MPGNATDGEGRHRPLPAVASRGESEVRHVEEIRVGHAVQPREALGDAGVRRVHLGRLGEPRGETAGPEAKVAEVGESPIRGGRVRYVEPAGVESPRPHDVRPVGGRGRVRRGGRAVVVEGTVGGEGAVVDAASAVLKDAT